jgi:hypothetical protein
MIGINTELPWPAIILLKSEFVFAKGFY